MPRQELQDMLCNRAETLEQWILYNWIFQQFDNGSAVNRRITQVIPMYSQRTVVGSEFLTYAATKLYICLSLSAYYYFDATTTTHMQYYNENNVQMGILSKYTGYWRNLAVTAHRYIENNYTWKNFYFSRLLPNNATFIRFIGYKINLA